MNPLFYLDQEDLMCDLDGHTYRLAQCIDGEVQLIAMHLQPEIEEQALAFAKELGFVRRY
jgi:hypothetical protein